MLALTPLLDGTLQVIDRPQITLKGNKLMSTGDLFSLAVIGAANIDELVDLRYAKLHSV